MTVYNNIEVCLMKKMNAFAATAMLALSCATAQADAVYGGIGFPGATIGYSHALSDTLAVRGEFSGGLSMNKNGTRNGVNFEGQLKANALSVLGDWYPTASGFRVTGGLSLNDTSFKLNSTGGSATINDKPVNLTGKTFNVDVTYPGATPYVGIGYGTKPNGAKGWGFYADAGVTIGKFKTSVSQNIVGTPTNTTGQTITQADVDAQVEKVRDSLNKVSVLPKFSLGASYSF